MSKAELASKKMNDPFKTEGYQYWNQEAKYFKIIEGTFLQVVLIGVSLFAFVIVSVVSKLGSLIMIVFVLGAVFSDQYLRKRISGRYFSHLMWKFFNMPPFDGFDPAEPPSKNLKKIFYDYD